MLDGIRQLHRYPGGIFLEETECRVYHNPIEMRAFNTSFNYSVIYSTKYTFNARLKEENLYH